LPPDCRAAPSCLRGSSFADLTTLPHARPPQNFLPGSPVECSAVVEAVVEDPLARVAESAEPEPAPPLPLPALAHRSPQPNSLPELPDAFAIPAAVEFQDRTSSECCSGWPCCRVAQPRPQQPVPGRGWPTTGRAAGPSFPPGAQSSRRAPLQELPTHIHASSSRPPAESSCPFSSRRRPG